MEPTEREEREDLVAQDLVALLDANAMLAADLGAAERERDAAEAECARLREQVAALTAFWQQAIDADLLDDPHELEAAIIKASALLNYPRTDNDD